MPANTSRLSLRCLAAEKKNPITEGIFFGTGDEKYTIQRSVTIIRSQLDTMDIQLIKELPATSFVLGYLWFFTSECSLQCFPDDNYELQFAKVAPFAELVGLKKIAATADDYLRYVLLTRATHTESSIHKDLWKGYFVGQSDFYHQQLATLGVETPFATDNLLRWIAGDPLHFEDRKEGLVIIERRRELEKAKKTAGDETPINGGRI